MNRERLVAVKAIEICKAHKAHFMKGENIDCIVCFKGKFLGIEFKAGYNKPTALQEREMMEINKAGGSAMVVREDTLDALEDWFKANA